jgi:5-methylcytosine-specific restriction endonuclease McrA
MDLEENKQRRKGIKPKVAVEVYRRDRWMCRWCNKPVIFPPVMKYLEGELRKSGNDTRLSYYHKNWSRAHAPLLDLLGAEIDHVEAFSAGGSDEIKNLVTSCHKCNIRKHTATLDKWAMRHMEKPIKAKYGEPQHWDGLSALFVLFAKDSVANLTVYERAWLKVLIE